MNRGSVSDFFPCRSRLRMVLTICVGLFLSACAKSSDCGLGAHEEKGICIADRSAAPASTANDAVPSSAIPAPAFREWTRATTPPGVGNIWSVACGNGMFIVAGDDGVMLSSKDGVAWSHLPKVTDGLISGLHYLGGRFLAAAPGKGLLSSADGITWEGPTAPGSIVVDLDFKDGQFVILGRGDIQFSADARTWSKPKYTGIYDDYLTAGKGQLVTIGFTAGRTDSEEHSNVSSDGITWEKYPLPSSEMTRAVEFYDPNFFALVDNELLSSQDGKSWKSEFKTSSGELSGMVRTATHFIIVGTQGLILVGTDPAKLETVKIEPVDLYRVASCDQIAVAIGVKGEIFYSR